MARSEIAEFVRSDRFCAILDEIDEWERREEAGIDEEETVPVRKTFRKHPPVVPSSKRTPLSWLKAVVSELDVGQKVYDAERECSHPIHLNRNDEIEKHFDRLRWASDSWLKNRWSNPIVKSHCSSKKTYYFSGASESYKTHTLVMIDVDCHNSGSLKGAMSFLEFLREKHFPNLYFEPSTNGNGGHGYFLLKKQGMGSQGIKPLLMDQLQPWLNDLAAGFDVEMVEVKGLPPELTWGNEQFELKTYKAGVLAKLPRGLIDRFDDLKNTTVLTTDDLQQLPVVEKTKTNSSSCVIGAVGSISGKFFGDEHLKGLKPGGKYHSLASALLSGEEMTTSSRAKVTVLDLAIFLMLGEHFTNNMNADGSLPTARWEQMWKSLFAEGDIVRAWDHKRFKLMRDRLSSLGLLEWEDFSFYLGRQIGDEYFPGRAAKWKFSDELMEKLAETSELTTSSVSGGEEKYPLWEQILLNWKNQLPQTPERRIIRPQLECIIPIRSYSPDELTTFVTQIALTAA